MTTFWILIALVVIVSLLLIWVPHFRHQQLRAEQPGVRQQTNLELFHERLVILEKERREELLDQSEFDALKKELEISLLQDIHQGQDESLNQEAKPKGLLWPIVMSICLLAISSYTYQRIGAYQQLENMASMSNHHGELTAEQMINQRIMLLEGEVQASPDNSQGWFNLGHSYISAERYEEAVAAFDRVMAIVGTHAELLGPKATALYHKAGQQMTPEIQALLDEALTLDPQDPSTLLLIGMDAYFTSNFGKAISSWQTILDSDRTDVDRDALINAIETAKIRMQAGAGTQEEDAVHQGEGAQQKRLTISVSVVSELASKVADTDTLYLFARSTAAPKMPLAMSKVSAAALPTSIILDDSSAIGDLKLSDVDEVEVIAIVSKHGTLKPQAGDLQGRLSQVTVGEVSSLLIDTEIK
jgi:cytochrome c-type biogenesis protein CcmH